MNTNPRRLPIRDCLDMRLSASDIRISRKPQPEYKLIFRLHLHNRENRSVRLIGRKWVLQEQNGSTRIVEAANIFNQQPILTPNAVFSYGGVQKFNTPPTAIQLFLFGTDSGNRPFITPPFSFPRHALTLPWK